MSKAAKKSVYILMVLLVAALGFAYVTFSNLEDANDDLQEVEASFVNAQNEFRTKETGYKKEIQEIKNVLDKTSSEKTNLTARVEEIELQTKQQTEILSQEISTITNDRDKWKRRIETIKGERDQLMVKIDGLKKQLEEKPEPEIVYVEKGAKPGDEAPDVAKAPSILPSGRAVDEQYWAELLQEKTSLEIDIQNLKKELSNKSISVVEIKQKNENLQLAVDMLESEKDDIATKAQHTVDMIDSISLELARTKNDKKFISNRAEKLSEENNELRRNMKKLVSVKNALEKSIVRITQEKDTVTNKLGRTETMIQSKIDEIWDIKEELDHSIRSSQTGDSSSEVELPPIVVSSSGKAESFNTGETAPGLNGQVISINEPNNFVIVDIGENSGIHLGDNLSVYRDSKYIARLEVIQVREDISAADLKDQWSKIKVGDVIR